MTTQRRKRIIRLLGVGFDADDDHIRVTQGDKFDVIMGSSESHEYINKLIQSIEEAMDVRGLSLDELTPEELTELVGSLF